MIARIHYTERNAIARAFMAGMGIAWLACNYGRPGRVIEAVLRDRLVRRP